jgi:ketosteroid isomerase-like protein
MVARGRTDGHHAPMTNADNKAQACEFLQALSVHDPVRGDALLHDDLVYWTAGKKHLFPYAGTRNKA